MKQHILPAIKLTAVMIVFFAIIYPLTVWGIAQLSPNQGKGKIIVHNGKKYYEANFQRSLLFNRLETWMQKTLHPTS